MADELEPSIAEKARAWESSVPVVDWTAFRTCGICRAPSGRPCTAMYRTVLDGRPDGPAVELQTAHGFRKRRTGR